MTDTKNLKRGLVAALVMSALYGCNVQYVGPDPLASDDTTAATGDTTSDPDSTGGTTGSGTTTDGGTGGDTQDGTNDGSTGGDTGADEPATDEPVLAFPGAEGFGAKATGGRGGDVIKVTNLDASGPGSLQDALNQSGPRIVVFDVSGVIEADMITIPHGDLTIAGQTAPGAGITIKGRLYAAYESGIDNIIIRHVRVRPPEFDAAVHGDANGFDAMQFSKSHRLMFDHVSVGFGVDETIDLYSARDVTIQWSNIQEAQKTSAHSDGDSHNYGLINGPDGERISVHHNLFAHNYNRNPAIANGPAEMVNNVVYNVRHGFIHHNPASGAFNIMGNYFKDGPSGDNFIPFFFDDENGGADASLAYYLENNYIDDPDDYVGVVGNPWATPYQHSSFEYIDWGYDSELERVTSRNDFSAMTGYHPLTVEDPVVAYESVLNGAGAFPRDTVDERDVAEVRNRTGEWGARVPADLMAGLTASTAPADSDDDGMPDDWESANGLDPSTPDDDTVMASGYTAIEEYINQRAEDIVGQ